MRWRRNGSKSAERKKRKLRELLTMLLMKELNSFETSRITQMKASMTKNLLLRWKRNNRSQWFLTSLTMSLKVKIMLQSNKKWKPNWLQTCLGLVHTKMQSSSLKILRQKAKWSQEVIYILYWRCVPNSDRFLLRWVSMRCQRTDSLRALSGTSIVFSSPKVIQLEMPMIPSS